MFIRPMALLLAALLASPLAGAKEAELLTTNPQLEARVMELSAELRCLVCQNQTIADSHADLAVDLRNQIRTQLQQGKSPDEIRRYMTDRYGDFVLYKPPFKPATALLWIGPPALLVFALAALFLMLRRRQQARPEDFDPDTQHPADAAHDVQEKPVPR
ncbi:MAG: cytochrome c-type biogenesis protein CcmH [Rubrivivax sp.]|nr:cytochrome c-type biogenesis protein CcmH [Rubrivivax sp.]